ncbi:MAG: GMP synthase subunit A [Thermoplasmata archaeon]
MKIYVVDNGGQWTHREYRVLKYLGVEAKIIPNDTDPKLILEENVDALVLSGGAPSISYEVEKLGRQGDYLKLNIPILGICVGAQFIALYFNGKVGPAKVPEFGKTEITVIEKDDLFINIPEKFIAWESHNDEVKELPENFIHLAYSENCKIQAFKHKELPIYGVQFHPEVENTEYGYQVFKNFIEVVNKFKKD